MRLAVRMLSVISVMLLTAAPAFANPRPTRTPMPDKDHSRPTRTPIELRATRTPSDAEQRTRKPTAPPTATRTPLSLNQRTRKPSEAPTATRTPLTNEPRPGHATKTPRATRTPIVKVENPTKVPRATRTPAGEEVRTRKPGAEARPTRTALIVEDRPGKPTKTARPTRTPASGDERTRKPAPETRPTRTPADDREPHATKSARPTRTPVVKDDATGGTRPTRTGVPTKTATPVPVFNESKVTASCRAIYKKDVTVVLSILNESGATIENITAGNLTVQRAPGTGFSLGSAPANFTRLTNGRTATFRWKGEFTTSAGACGFSVSATAEGPNGERIEIPLTDCGSVVKGDAEGDLVPVCLGGGAGEGGAEGCGNSEPPPVDRGIGLPDLTIDAGALSSSMKIEERAFSGGSCALAERCVGAPGVRKLLRFSTRTPNIGSGDLYLGDPRSGGNGSFQYSQCHAHYHFNGYANYRLLGGGGQIVATGHKQAFCLLDLDPNGSNAGPPKYHCLNQGISAGWADIYDRSLDCQWVDVTGVAPGSYTLEVSINPGHSFEESNYGNNVARVPVTIP